MRGPLNTVRVGCPNGHWFAAAGFTTTRIGEPDCGLCDAATVAAPIERRRRFRCPDCFHEELLESWRFKVCRKCRGNMEPVVRRKPRQSAISAPSKEPMRGLSVKGEGK